MTGQAPSEGASILLVDADVCAAACLQEPLDRSGYVVRLAASAACALAILEAATADLILLNLLLPDTDGLILCRNLRARTDAPIIVLSARPRAVDRLLAVELGARDLVAKPVELSQLLASIEVALVDSGRIEQVASSR
ncbi:MAG: response regulator [Chloroflexota bacterium]|nr:response regulator [Chloroflexota bacterium]